MFVLGGGCLLLGIKLVFFYLGGYLYFNSVFFILFIIDKYMVFINN